MFRCSFLFQSSHRRVRSKSLVGLGVSFLLLYPSVPHCIVLIYLYLIAGLTSFGLKDNWSLILLFGCLLSELEVWVENFMYWLTFRSADFPKVLMAILICVMVCQLLFMVAVINPDYLRSLCSLKSSGTQTLSSLLRSCFRLRHLVAKPRTWNIPPCLLHRTDLINLRIHRTTADYAIHRRFAPLAYEIGGVYFDSAW
jgi:hypothetical protein